MITSFLTFLKGVVAMSVRPFGSRLWVDDLRPAPWFWVWAKDYDDAKALIDARRWQVVSLDHDLADRATPERTGYDLLLHIVQRKVDELSVPAAIRVHSANPVGVERMQGVIARYL